MVRLLLATTLTAATASQLQLARTTRVQIEQAKGALMAGANLTQQEAWERLRGTARSTRRPVSQVAAEVLSQLTGEPTAASGGEAARR